LGIIYGQNASGKSNLLRALEFVRNLMTEPLEKKTDVIEYDMFKFKEPSKEDTSKFRIVFIANKIRYEYQVILDNHSIHSEELYYHSPNRAKVFSRTTNQKKKLSTISFGSKIKISREDKKSLENNTLWNNTTLGGFLKTNIDVSVLSNFSDWFTDNIMELIDAETYLFDDIFSSIEKGEISKARLVEMLSKADFNITDMEIAKEKEILYRYPFLDIRTKNMSDNVTEFVMAASTIDSKKVVFEHTIQDENGNPSRHRLDFIEQSLGTQRFFQFAGLIALMMEEPKLFIIDEFEASLHPDLVTHLIKTLLVNVESGQLLLTTHMRELLLERDILRNDAIYFVDKLEDGSTDLYSAEDFDSSVLRRKESSLYNAYKIGKLGATPELNDTFLNGLN
jgi:AAA15 family ATPase/GTPase